ncbi:hypothetical protein FQ084_01270 [Psychrobacter sp. ANT_WB68]|nr:hypothetical protein FQ084_01270 [Psychrobacter sp. ANT_WB68]
MTILSNVRRCRSSIFASRNSMSTFSSCSICCVSVCMGNSAAHLSKCGSSLLSGLINVCNAGVSVLKYCCNVDKFTITILSNYASYQ